MRINLTSVLVDDQDKALRFYTDVLGFAPIRRPGSFDFDGAWCVSSYLGGGNGPRRGLFTTHQTQNCIKLKSGP